MKFAPFLICIMHCCFICERASSQLTQTIRGKVVDNAIQTPLAGASVTLINMGKSAITGIDGSFRIDGVTVGMQRLAISFVGYKTFVTENIQVIAGKETVINISLEPMIDMEEAVTVTASGKRNNPSNEFSEVSARAFNVDEAQKYAASVNDPLRMATNFPGVVALNSGNKNDIVIRGNSPNGLLWRLEGVDIPNPNHFANIGSSGGGISILSGQMLANSDFLTGAFAADYGNALSGVFDLKLRKGNNEHPEYSVQAGVLGLDLAAEGPLAAKGQGSYLVNYRYSTLQLLDDVGINLVNGETDFQDLSFNIALPAGKAGTFTLFGFGGLSSRGKGSGNTSAVQQSGGSNTGAAGLTHTIPLSNRSVLSSAVCISGNNIFTGNSASVPGFAYSTNQNYIENKWIVSSVFNHKFNNRNSLRIGVYYELPGFTYRYDFQHYSSGGTPDSIAAVAASGQTQMIQAFAEWQIKPIRHITVNAGLHYTQLLLNDSKALEPRASAKWDINGRNNIAFAFGSHSQMQAMGIYFGQSKDVNGHEVRLNRDLRFTQAFHYVLSYNYALSRYDRIKTEIYYQDLYHAPVSINDSDTYCTLNDLTGNYISTPLMNRGKGRNYGIELSLERSLSENFYYLLSGSLYQSKYTASDGIELNSRFNAGYASNLVIGKDLVYANGNRRLGLNLKIVYTGGFRETPIDLAASRQQGRTAYIDKEAYDWQLPAYFRTDIRVSYQWNKRHITRTLSLDIQNVTNRKNVFDRYYDPLKNAIANDLDNGLIPVLNYKIDFF